MLKTHAPVPEQLPPHPAKAEPEPAAAVRVTLVEGAKEALHVEPQSIPAGVLVTEPEPVPAFETVSVLLVGGAVASNWAVTVAEELVIAHWPWNMKSQPAVKLTKTEPASAIPLSRTGLELDGVKAPEQVAPQSIPAGLLVTRPEPVPVLFTVIVPVSASAAVSARPVGLAAEPGTVDCAETWEPSKL